jgi:hypothetical protein
MPLIMVGQNLQDRYAELMLEILRRIERMAGARNA